MRYQSTRAYITLIILAAIIAGLTPKPSQQTITNTFIIGLAVSIPLLFLIGILQGKTPPPHRAQMVAEASR